MRDAPSNAQVLSGDPLTRQGHADLANLLNANLGSVSLSNGSGSPYQSDVSYRGFQATSLLGSPTGLSVYLDGVRMNESFGSIVNWDLIPLNAISEIEVLPGSNPLFGLNTLGGSLVLRTKNGRDNPGRSLTAQFGSFNRRSAEGEAGGRFGPGKTLDWFVSGNYDQQDGYRTHTSTTVQQLYAKLRWQSSSSHLELGTVWSATSLNGTQGLPESMLSHPTLAYTWPDNVSNNQLILNLKAEKRVAPAIVLSGNFYYRRSDAISSNSNAGLNDACRDGSRDCSASAPNGTAVDLYVINPFEPGTAQYANFTSYPGPLPIHDYTGNIDTELVRSRTRQSSFGGNLLIDVDNPVFGLNSDFNAGGSFEAAKIGYGQRTSLADLVNYETVPMPWNLKYGSKAGFAGSPLISTVALSSRESSFNLFARDTLKLSRTFSLSGSISFTFTRLELNGMKSRLLGDNGDFSWIGENGLTYYAPSYVGSSYWTTSSIATSMPGSYLATVAAPAGGSAGPELAPLQGSHNYRKLNPSIGLSWNPARVAGFFANYSQAMRAPTAIELACADPVTPCALPTGFNGDPNLRAVIAHTVEAGARGAAGPIKWNAAVYRSVLEDDIQFIFDSSGLGYFADVGKTERVGVEAGISANLQRVQLSASYGFVRATYRSSFTDADGNVVSPGMRITGLPAQSFKLRALYSPQQAITVGANLIAVAGQYAHGDEANRGTAVPGYALVNLDAHVKPARDIELFANVNNLFDHRYATFGVMGTNIYSARDEQFRTPAPGRTFVIGLRYDVGDNARL